MVPDSLGFSGRDSAFKLQIFKLVDASKLMTRRRRRGRRRERRRQRRRRERRRRRRRT